MLFVHSQMWMSVYKKQTSAVLTPCAATPKGHITAAVRQGTLEIDETVHGLENPLIPSKVGSRSFNDVGDIQQHLL